MLTTFTGFSEVAAASLVRLLPRGVFLTCCLTRATAFLRPQTALGAGFEFLDKLRRTQRTSALSGPPDRPKFHFRFALLQKRAPGALGPLLAPR